MKKVTLALSAITTLLIASGSHAAPVALSLDQMDTVAGGAFVCPVISTDAVLNAKNGVEINGAYSVVGPTVSVPVHATNGNGAGSPGGSFSSPGDTDYTAIWN